MSISTLLLILIPLVLTKTIYIDPNQGIDSGNCTIQPCKTFGYVLNPLRTVSGDTIIIKRGTFTIPTIQLNVGVVLKSEDSVERSVLRFNNFEAIRLIANNTNYWIEDLELMDFSYGIIATGKENVSLHINRAIFRNSREAAIYLGGRKNFLNLTNSTFDNIRQCAVRLIGVVRAHSTLESSGNMFQNCETAYDGGAMRIEHFDGWIKKSEFRHNTGRNGGALSLGFDSSITIEECTFVKNKVIDSSGGAIEAFNSTLVVRDSIFENNTVDGGGEFRFGGAIICNAGKCDISKSIFRFNESPKFGGAISTTRSQTRISDCMFEGNMVTKQTKRYGGAVYTESDVDYKIQNSRFVRNKAVSGAGIAIWSNATLENCEFEENVAESYGGGVYIGKYIGLDPSSVTVKKGNFIKNACNNAGGGIYAEGTQDLLIMESTFSNNTSNEDGAAIRFLSSETVNIIDSAFFYNSAPYGGGAIYGYKTELFSTYRSLFKGNKATNGGGGAIHAIEIPFRRLNAGGVILEKSTFEENYAEKDGGALNLGGRAEGGNFLLDVKECKFRRNVAREDGGAVHLEGTAQVQTTFPGRDQSGREVIFSTIVFGANFTDCIFSENEAMEGIRSYGGAVSILGLTIRALFLRNSFISNKAVRGGSMYILSKHVFVNSTLFENNTAKTGGCVYCQLCKVRIADSEFIKCNSTQFLFEGTDLGDGGGVWVSGGDASFYNVNFTSNFAAQYGAGLLCQQDSTCSLQKVRMSENEASIGGGAITNKYGGISLSDVSIFNNKAQFGAGLMFSVKTWGFFSLEGENYLFQNNASIAGGAFYCSEGRCGLMQRLLNQKGLIHRDNYANGYGDVLASDPRTIKFHSVTINEKNGKNNATLVNSSYLFQVFPDQPFTIKVEVLDEFRNRVIRYPGLSVNVRLDSKGFLFGANLEQSVVFGEAVFRDLSLRGVIGEIVQLHFSSPQIFRDIGNLLLHVKLSQCAPGFKTGIVNTTDSVPVNTCILCLPGTYNFLPGQSECHPCPSVRAVCMGEQVIAHKGFWTYYNYDGPNKGHAEVHYCPNGKCLGDNLCVDERNTSFPLCAACKEGYSEWNGKCIQCKGVNVLFLILYLVYIIGFFFFTHITSQTPSSGATKILFFCGQTLLLIVGSSQWMSWFSAIFGFNFLVPTGNSSSTFECPFPRNSYIKLFMDVVRPSTLIMLWMVCLFTKTILKLLYLASRRKRDNSKEEKPEIKDASKPKIIPESQQPVIELSKPAEATEKPPQSEPTLERKTSMTKKLAKAVVRKLRHTFWQTNSYFRSLGSLQILSYQSITGAAFSFMACRSIGTNRYLVDASDIQCGSTQWLSWLPLYVLLLIYAVSFPFVILITLVVAKKKQWLTYKEQTRFYHMFGIFYLNYKSSRYWWEFVALFRRTLFIACFVINNLIGIDIGQIYFMIVLLLGINLWMQRKLKPFRVDSDNAAEEISLGTLILVCMIRGSFLFSQDEGIGMTITLSLIIPVLLGLAVHVIRRSIFGEIIKTVFRKVKRKFKGKPKCTIKSGTKL